MFGAPPHAISEPGVETADDSGAGFAATQVETEATGVRVQPIIAATLTPQSRAALDSLIKVSAITPPPAKSRPDEPGHQSVTEPTWTRPPEPQLATAILPLPLVPAPTPQPTADNAIPDASPFVPGPALPAAAPADQALPVPALGESSEDEANIASAMQQESATGGSAEESAVDVDLAAEPASGNGSGMGLADPRNWFAADGELLAFSGLVLGAGLLGGAAFGFGRTSRIDRRLSPTFAHPQPLRQRPRTLRA